MKKITNQKNECCGIILKLGKCSKQNNNDVEKVQRNMCEAHEKLYFIF